MVRRGRARVLRSVAVGAAGAGLAVCAHVLAGGAAPSAATVAAAGTALAGLAWGAARGPLGTARLIGLLGAAQAVLHALFAFAEPAAGHAHHAAGAAGGPSSAGEGAMVTAHLAATLALALLLRRGEAWLFRAGHVVARLARRLCDRDRQPAAVSTWHARPHPAPQSVFPARRPLVGAASRRGPPVAAPLP